MGLSRVWEYRHLAPDDLHPPQPPNVFFDPADTEVGIWATVDLLEPGCSVLDLGSGSGAAAAAVARAGAGRVHGIDVSENSVGWATERYGSEAVTFAVGDVTELASSALLDALSPTAAPVVVASNPPYVPIPESAGSERVSVDGGVDGLRLVRTVVSHAAALGARLALTIGSYSSPRLAASILDDAGFEIVAVTLGPLRLGEYTARNVEQVAALEAAGEGPLLRTRDGGVWYLVVGLSCRRRDGAGMGALAPDALLPLLAQACESRTPALEALDDPLPSGPVPVRVVVLPDETARRHC